jgi:hypothetical protein
LIDQPYIDGIVVRIDPKVTAAFIFSGTAAFGAIPNYYRPSGGSDLPLISVMHFYTLLFRAL